jgi:hypothetical protein
MKKDTAVMAHHALTRVVAAASMAVAVAVPFASAVGQQKVGLRSAVTSTPSVRLEGAISSIRVVGWKHDSVELVGMIPDGAKLSGGFVRDKPGPAMILKGIIGPAVGAKMIFEGSTGKGAILELRVPLRARVWIKAPDASVTSSGVIGGLDISIVGGSVTVSGPSRQLNVESMDGRVTIDGSTDWLRVKTATGDISMTGGSGDAGFTTISGAIRVTDGQFERAKFESVDGPITFAADPSRGAALDFQSHSGPITLRLVTARTNAAIEASAQTSTIVADSSTFGRPIPDGRGESLRTDLGSPDATITIRTFRGIITLTGR